MASVTDKLLSHAETNSLLLIQKQLFDLQHLDISSLPSDPLSNQKVSSILLRRNLIPDLKKLKRRLDNEEITLLGMLDSSGNLSAESRLVEFMVLLTRLTKADHRFLCQYILTEHISENCKIKFVELGGLRILKRWIVNAIENDRIVELTSIVDSCRNLPFDAKSVKETDLGKIIKKLSKHNQGKQSELKVLHDSAVELMKDWKKQINSKIDDKNEKSNTNNKNHPIELNTLINNVKTKLSQNAEKFNKDEEITKNYEALEHPDSLPLNSTSSDSIDEGMKNEEYSPDSSLSLNKPNKRSSISSPSFLSSPTKENKTEEFHDETLQPITMELIGTNEKTTKDASNEESYFKNPFLNGFSATAPTATTLPVFSGLNATKTTKTNRERKPLDMAEGARKLLAQRALAKANSQKSTVSVEGNNGEDMKDEKPIRRGGLKKPRGEEDKKPKEKLKIKWADEHGKKLRETFILEVDKIKSKLKEYKNHKELMKKEKQIEQDTQMSQSDDSMQSNIPWTTPELLSLSIEVLDNRAGVLESREKEEQTKRLSHVLEVRYLDDSLIPVDPEESSFTHDPAELEALENEADIIPWYQPGTEPPPPAPVPHTDHMDIDSFIDSAHNLVSGAGGDSYRGHEAPDAALISDLPPSLQSLDPGIIQILVNDVALFQSILKSDGTVDDFKLISLVDSINLGVNNQLSYNSGSLRGKSRWADNNSLPTGNDYYGRVLTGRRDIPPPPQITLPDQHQQKRGGNKNQKKFPTQKSSVPCRFFNTPKGCQYGDNCAFGHFAPEYLPLIESRTGFPPPGDDLNPPRPAFGGGGGRGKFGGQRASGPGSRRHLQQQYRENTDGGRQQKRPRR